jgi:hypothetical protein
MFLKKDKKSKLQALMKIDKPCIYEICVNGQLTNRWFDWFNGLVIHYDTEGKTTLRGALADQAALIGVLNKIQALNLTVISVKRSNPEDRELG